MAEDDPLPEADRVPGFAHPREAVSLVGQARAEAQFLAAWRDSRLHHAWLLRGPRGIGKATLAYRIARALIAEEAGGGLFGHGPAVPETLDPPEICPVRTRMMAQAEARLFVLRRAWDPDRKRLQTQIAVDHVRALRRFLQLSAPDGGWRVVIVDPADEMNRSSANALLKYLEEPPERTVFLLVSHAPSGLLPTIRSRCRTLDLAPLDEAAMADALAVAAPDLPEGDTAALAALAGGSVGDALRLTAGDGVALYRRIVGVMAGPVGVDRAGMTSLAEGCAGQKGAEQYRLILDLVQLLVARLARAAATRTPEAEAAPGEHALIAAAAATRDQAPLWAEASARIAARARHAVAVNLDPAQVVIDIFLELDATLAKTRTVAA